MVTWLRQVGRIREGKDVELEILYEVFRASASLFACPECGRTGLSAANAVEGVGNWPGTPTCLKCGRPIARERLEAVPQTRVCAACQQDAERGIQKEDKTYCPRCGAPMEVRAIPQGNRTRYVLGCSAHPPCPL